MHRRSHLHVCVLVVSLTVLTALSATADATATGRPVTQLPVDDNLEGTQSSLRQRQADLAAELDVLHATSQEVSEALAVLDRNVADQEQQTTAAAAAVVASKQAVADATTLVDAKEAEVATLEKRLKDIAVSLYVRPPADDAIYALVTSDPNEAGVTFALARARVDNAAEVLAAAEQARDSLAAARRAAQAALVDAERTEEQQRARLAELQTAQRQQQDFALVVSDRIEHSLGEAAQLAVQDAELSAQIQQRELELARRLQASSLNVATKVIVVHEDASGEDTASADREVAAPPTSPAQPTTPPVTSGTRAALAAPPDTNAPGPTTAATLPPTTTTTAPVRIIRITPVDTTWIRGIEVATAIAPQLESMLDAAAADGLMLTGSGYRNILDQIQIRREVCGPTDYDIFLKPSWECSPPVAIPGRSMHEKGLAVDFSGENGDLIRTRDHPAFKWLETNAARFGFKNLPSEPWHWSTNGG